MTWLYRQRGEEGDEEGDHPQHCGDEGDDVEHQPRHGKAVEAVLRMFGEPHRREEEAYQRQQEPEHRHPAEKQAADADDHARQPQTVDALAAAARIIDGDGLPRAVYDLHGRARHGGGAALRF